MSSSSTENSHATSTLRVAVADDDRSMRELLQHMLHKQGHEVVALAESGKALIEQCAVAQPDVIITDNLMPEVDGADAAAIIYAQRPTPIILLSGYCDRNLVLEAEQKHVLIYLVKPLSEDNLRSALDRCRALMATPTDRNEPPTSALDTESPGRSPRKAPYPQAIRPSASIKRDA
jgi:CheY-like chemotaxis protein